MLVTQINFYYLAILRDFGEAAGAKYPAFVHNGYGRGKGFYKGHVVLYHNHGSVFANYLQQFASFGAFGGGHAGNGLIYQ